MISSTTIFYALLGGVLPALIWLTFWLREDGKRPEPRGLIMGTFLLGMLSVLVVIPFQVIVNRAFPAALIVPFLIWAMLEELFKLAAAYFGGLRTKDDDEPIDPLIYMITAALGFAAMENTLYLLRPILDLDLAGSLLTGNLRFIGASVLHAVSSAIIGIALGLSFYKKRRTVFVLGAFALAVLYHTAFNLALAKEHGLSNPMALVWVWLGVTVVLLFFEKLKSMRRSLSTSASSQVARADV